MRNLIHVIVLLSAISAIACGPAYNPEGEFYNLLNQEITLNKEFFPFLRSDYGFYGDNYYYDEYEEKKSENLNIWQTEILPKISKTEVEQLLFSHSKHTFDSIIKINGLNRNSDVVKYLKYIHKLKNRTNSHIRFSWDYEVILGKYKPNASATIEDAKERFTATKNLQIKQRYLYQLVRLYHYNGFYSDAIEVFEQHKNEFDKNEIYYYTLDQVGGCYYSLEDYKQAAIHFISVFKNSKDKKVSSFNSYKFTMSRLGGQIELMVPEELYATYKLLTALRFPNLTFNILDDLKANHSQSLAFKLLYMREVNNLERIKNESNKGFTYAGIKNKSNFIKTLNRIKKLNNSVTKTNQNKDYWLIIDSYLEFLGGNIKRAEVILSKVNSYELTEAKNVLTNVYKLHQWESIGPIEEEHLATILDANIFFEDHYYRKNVSADWKHYFLEEVAHKYFEQGDLAKSFLLHNDYNEIGKVGSLELLNDIEKLNYKLTPNSFEKIILMQLKRADERSEIEYIHYLKGLLYLQKTEFDKAKIEFEKSTSFSSEKVVPRYVFNQNIIEAFWIKEYKKMTLFHADYYKNEIKNLMNYLEITDLLIKLSSSDNSSNLVAQIEANTLLGNFYFNVSNTGFYRGILFDYEYKADYNYFASMKKYERITRNYIDKKTLYNFSNLNYTKVPYSQLAKKASKFYLKALTNCTNPELASKLKYYLAKCELNYIYNNEEDYILSKVNHYNSKYKKRLQEIREDDSDFSRQIIKECTYFNIY